MVNLGYLWLTGLSNTDYTDESARSVENFLKTK